MIDETPTEIILIRRALYTLNAIASSKNERVCILIGLSTKALDKLELDDKLPMLACTFVFNHDRKVDVYSATGDTISRSTRTAAVAVAKNLQKDLGRLVK